LIVKPGFHLLPAAGVIALSAAVSVQAQTPPVARQPQGLFGGVRPDTAATTRVDLTASLLEGYDSDVPTYLLPTIDPQNLQSGGFSTILGTTAEYAWRNSRTQVGANVTSVVRHYADLGETRGVGSSFGVGVSSRLPGRITLMANQSAAYTPAYLSGLFPKGVTVEPGSAGTTAPDYTVSNFKSNTYQSTVSLRRDFSQRSSFFVSGDFQYSDRREESPLWGDVSGQWFRGLYSRSVSRNATISTEYRYRSGAFGYTDDLRTTEHALDFGVNYSKPLSATRRASVGFNVGVSNNDVPQPVQSGGNSKVRQYLGTGSVNFEYQIQRTWHARANYRRGIEYVVDIPEPLFADSWGVAVDGFVSRRIDVEVFAGFSTGKSLLNTSGLAYDTYTGAVRARYALTRLTAIYTEYLYYFYDFAEGTPLLVGVPPGLERHGVRAGLTLWMPALRK